MMFIESPSQFAPLAEWEAWLIRLDDLPQDDISVIWAKERAQRVIATLKEDALDNAGR